MFFSLLQLVVGGLDSVVYVTGWTVSESTSHGGELFGSRPDRPRDSPGLLYNEYWVSVWGKATGMSC